MRVNKILPTFYKLCRKLHARIDDLYRCDVQPIIPFAKQQDHVNSEETEALKLFLDCEWSSAKVKKSSDNVHERN